VRPGVQTSQCLRRVVTKAEADAPMVQATHTTSAMGGRRWSWDNWLRIGDTKLVV